MRNNEIDGNKICHHCVKELYISKKIKENGVKDKCAYCSAIEKTITLDELADHVTWSFENYFKKTSLEPDWYEELLIRDNEIEYNWNRSGDPIIYVIADILEVTENIASDLQNILFTRSNTYEGDLVEVEFDPESHYEYKPPDISEINYDWEMFQYNLQFRSRYFRQSPKNFLDTIFRDLVDLEAFFEPALIVEAGPNLPLNEFYRARYFETERDLARALAAPDIELGPPPSDKAIHGRMNARGISVFYGSNSAETALAEIRPPVGSLVLVGRFRLIRRVRLLNLHQQREIHNIGSYFDPKFLDLFKRAIFLRDLAALMSRPVLPIVAESEYLPTQVISDYLANMFSTPFDGILFPSTQEMDKESLISNEQGSSNVVLFNGSSKVRDMAYPKNAEVQVTGLFTVEIDDNRLIVEVNVPGSDEKVVASRKSPVSGISSEFEDFLALSEPDLHTQFDTRFDTLEVDRESLSVHIINGVKIFSSSNSVTWCDRSSPKYSVEF